MRLILGCLVSKQVMKSKHGWKQHAFECVENPGVGVLIKINSITQTSFHMGSSLQVCLTLHRKAAPFATHYLLLSACKCFTRALAAAAPNCPLGWTRNALRLKRWINAMPKTLTRLLLFCHRLPQGFPGFLKGEAGIQDGRTQRVWWK